jgi:Fe2+ transport system protein FeoA
MNAVETLQELDAIIIARLSGHGPWLVDPETANALNRKLMQMGLWEGDPVIALPLGGRFPAPQVVCRAGGSK